MHCCSLRLCPHLGVIYLNDYNDHALLKCIKKNKQHTKPFKAILTKNPSYRTMSKPPAPPTPLVVATTWNSLSGLQCTKPVQPVATEVFILVQLLQLLMQLLMSQDESDLHKRLTAEAGNEPRPQCKHRRILRIWKSRISLKQEL